ncbi:MAG: hypothetical protein ACO1OT_02535, partial [Heyndrickxia sp.]
MEDWDIVKQNAKIAKQAKTVFQSFVQQRLYRINKILEDRILIDRVSGGKPAAFKKQEVVDAINTLKKTKRVKKDALLNSVVREVLLVRLHPDVAWDEKTHELYWKPDPHQLIVNKVQDLIPEAPDDQLEKVYTLIAQRRHQNKFRKALMKLYGNKCAISGCDVDVVLQAAHISRY